MKRACIAILLLFSIQSLSGQNVNTVIDFHFSNAGFNEFTEYVFNNTGVKIYYVPSQLDTIRVNIDADSISVILAVERILGGTGLFVSEWNNNLVIMPGKLISDLPRYEAGKASDSVPMTLREENVESRYLTGRKAEAIQTITVGRKGAVSSRSVVRVTGRVTDSETGEPLISVPVYIAETRSGALSDLNGSFTFALPPGKFSLQAGYLGYEQEKYTLVILSEGSFTISLKKATIRLQDVVVTGESSSAMRIKQPGLEQISVRNIRSLPVMLGERDILKVTGTLPGIVSEGEGSAGLNVRGSGSDENAFYLNRIPVYNTAHLFGFFSAFNSDIIKDFSVYKGHVPVEFGGRLASVFNITARQGNRRNYTARGGISPVAANLVAEGPLKKDTASFILSARSTYSDWILSRIKDTTINASSAHFDDISGGLNWDLGKTRLSAFYYHSYDYFRLDEITRFNYSNDGGSLVINRNIGNAVRGELSLTGSAYGFSTAENIEASSAWKHSYRLKQYGLHSIFMHTLNERHTLEYGTEFSLYLLDRGELLPYGEKSLLEKVVLGREKGVESALFISDLWKLRDWFTVNAGFRYALFNPLGPADVYLYAEGSPVDRRYITDTLTYKRNKAIKWYKEPEIRIAVNLMTDENGSLKFSYNQMHQNLFMLNTTMTLAPNTQWKLADYHLSPSESRQLSFGIFRTMPEQALEGSVEVFFKQSNNFPEFRGGADFLKNALVETNVLQGKQKAYGLEVYIKRSRRKLEGWLSYTYSRSLVKVTGEHAWERINNGLTYPSDYDIPSSLNAVMNYYFSRRVILSAIFTYRTGRPVTYPESVYYLNGSPFLNYSARNAYRIPDYFRTDVSLTIEGNLRARKPIHSSYIFNLYNATGRLNPYSVYFNTEGGKIRSYKYSVIGVPVFTATWLFKFGNYASE